MQHTGPSRSTNTGLRINTGQGTRLNCREHSIQGRESAQTQDRVPDLIPRYVRYRPNEKHEHRTGTGLNCRMRNTQGREEAQTQDITILDFRIDNIQGQEVALLHIRVRTTEASMKSHVSKHGNGKTKVSNDKYISTNGGINISPSTYMGAFVYRRSPLKHTRQ